MPYTAGRQKSFLQRFVWVGILLLALGAVFGGVAIFIQLIPLAPGSISMYANGVLQPSTEETVRTFRLIFLLSFGSVGLGLAVAAAIVILRNILHSRQARRLKAEGAMVTAEIVGYAPSAIYINRRSLLRLRCAYAAPDGKTYIFKSGLLRMDPAPYLSAGQVTVYYDPNNIRHYFVDVDGSAGAGSQIVEL
ncbi:MAG: DUF3592 domain-containing protein [Oscillospiraceae bacterium]